MTINAQALLDYPVPDVRHTLRKEEVAFYALSVGAGQDPMDQAELALVDPAHGPVMLPSFVTVLCTPVSWFKDPATGIDPLHVVHGEQGFRILRPPPVEGPILGRTRVTGVIDKGPGRGALIYSEKELLDEITGEVFATATSTTFARANGGFGGPAGPVRPVHAVPPGLPDAALERTTRPEQALYYRLNGDTNPIHSDPATATAAGFPRPILHGLCTLGVVGAALVRMLCGDDPSRLQGLDLRFSAPVFPGDSILVETWNDGSFRARVPERNVTVADNGLATIAGR